MSGSTTPALAAAASSSGGASVGEASLLPPPAPTFPQQGGSPEGASASLSGDSAAVVASSGNDQETVSFRIQKCNNHTLLNRWMTVDETRAFQLQTKEKKAFMTSQCRIVVKGSKHFPLQLADGPTIESLYGTWRYCRRLEDEALPRDLDVKGVEQWMRNHVAELYARAQGAGGGSSRNGAGSGASDDEEYEEHPEGDDDHHTNGNGNGNGAPAANAGSAAAQPNGARPGPVATGTASGSGSGAAGTGSPTNGLGLGGGFFLRAARPTTKDQWKQAEATRIQARNNRRLAAMVFTAVYTTLMRYMSSDGFLLLLFLLELFTFYLWTHYRDIAVTLAKRAGENRVDRVKDWFYFGLGRRDERKQKE